VAIADDAEFGRRARRFLQKIERERALKYHTTKDDFRAWDRLKVRVALGAVAELLRLDGQEKSAAWVNRIALGFLDLDRGVVGSLFSPEKRNSRPFEQTVVWCLRARVAAAMELSITRLGEKRKDAAEKMAKKFPDIRYIAKPRTALAASLVTWRDEFKKRRVENGPAYDSYWFWLDWPFRFEYEDGKIAVEHDAIGPDELRECIDWILQSAAQEARTFGPGSE